MAVMRRMTNSSTVMISPPVGNKTVGSFVPEFGSDTSAMLFKCFAGFIISQLFPFTKRFEHRN